MLTCKWETSWGGDVEMWHKLIELSWEIDLYEGLDVGDHEVAEFVYVSFTCSILFIDSDR